MTAGIWRFYHRIKFSCIYINFGTLFHYCCKPSLLSDFTTIMQVERNLWSERTYTSITTYLSKALSRNWHGDCSVIANRPLATSNLPRVSATSHLNAENFYTHLMDNDPYFLWWGRKITTCQLALWKSPQTKVIYWISALLEEYLASRHFNWSLSIIASRTLLSRNLRALSEWKYAHRLVRLRQKRIGSLYEHSYI